jgi:hypothetical protein
VLVVQYHEYLARPWLAWAVLVVMSGWTALTTYAYARPAWRTSRLLTADLVVAFGCLFATGLAATPFYLTQAPPLSSYWFAGAALSASVIWGRRGAATVALGYGFADITLRVLMDANVTAATVRGVVLLLLACLAVGYMASMAEQAEERFAQAVTLEARLRERQQLARSIHDSVLQVLALVRRRGDELGGEAAELGRMAGEQEVRLRSMITDGLDSAAAGSSVPGGASAPTTAMDLRDALRRLESVRFSVSAPATPVLLPGYTVAELAAAVAAALDIVDRHCPPQTRAWVLVEDEEHAVTVRVDLAQVHATAEAQIDGDRARDVDQVRRDRGGGTSLRVGLCEGGAAGVPTEERTDVDGRLHEAHLARRATSEAARERDRAVGVHRDVGDSGRGRLPGAAAPAVHLRGRRGVVHRDEDVPRCAHGERDGPPTVYLVDDRLRRLVELHVAVERRVLAGVQDLEPGVQERVAVHDATRGEGADQVGLAGGRRPHQAHGHARFVPIVAHGVPQ